MFRRREQHLTVDCIAYNSIEENKKKNYFVIQYNINIPAAVVNNPIGRLEALERARVLIESDFGLNETVDYQITGTYELKNVDTNMVREWVGNFYAGLNNPSIIQDFQLFEGFSFVNTVWPLLENVGAKLLFNGRDSKWKFERLQSIILNVQSTVYENHPLLQKRKLLQGKRKFHRSFDLP
jgi:hypothetical protein